MSCNGVPQLGGEGYVCSKKWAVPAATKTRMVQFANVLGTIMQNPQTSDFDFNPPGLDGQCMVNMQQTETKTTAAKPKCVQSG
jgi:hypothetical protein